MCERVEETRPIENAVTIQLTPAKDKQPICITVSSVLDDILVYPHPSQKQKSTNSKKSKATGPDYRHLSGDQMIAYLKAKEREKLDEAERKAKAKQAREDKRMAKQAEMERKAEKRAEREAKRKGKQAETGRKATSKARTAKKGGKEERQSKSQGAVKSVRLPANGSDSEVSDEGDH